MHVLAFLNLFDGVRWWARLNGCRIREKQVCLMHSGREASEWCHHFYLIFILMIHIKITRVELLFYELVNWLRALSVGTSEVSLNQSLH